MVLPVLVLVAFNAIIPLMTVVNYSVQETFGNNEFFWVGAPTGSIQVLRPTASTMRWDGNLMFTGMILAIEIPLGIHGALHADARVLAYPVCLVLMALPLLIPWNVVGTMWNIFALRRHRPARLFAEAIGIDYNYTQSTGFDAWITVIVMDVWHWTSLWCCSAMRVWYRSRMPIIRQPRSTAHPLGRVPLHPAAEDEARADLIAILLRFMDSFMIYTEPFVSPAAAPAMPPPSCRSIWSRSASASSTLARLLHFAHLLPDHPVGLLGVLHRDDQ